MEEKWVYFAHSLVFFFFFFSLLEMSSYLASGGKKSNPFQPALYIACVNLEVLEAVLEDYSI